MKDIKGYNALVTGGTSGMGWEYCQQLAAKGCNILMVSIQQEQLEKLPKELTEKYGVKAWGLYMDLSKDSAAREVWDYCQEQHIEIDILINNAGMFFFHELDPETQGKANTMLQLHAITPTRLVMLFGEAMKVLDERIAAQPDELRWRYMKITALSAYEKESPDMAAAELRQLISRDASARPAWTLDGEPAGTDIFQQGVGEYCAQFFETGSAGSYEYFREISELMSKRFPKNPVFIDNIGSYWLVAKNNDKQAVKFYKKALKIDPSDAAATRNLQIIERRQAAAKAKSKGKK